MDELIFAVKDLWMFIPAALKGAVYCALILVAAWSVGKWESP